MNHPLAAFEHEMFTVALSFAGEQREYAEELAFSLQAKQVKVFYDNFHVPQMWGCDLVDTLSDLYSKRTKLVIIFVSKNYVEKDFTNVERRAAISKAIKVRSRYIFPLSFDDTELPGLPDSTAYLKASDKTPEQLAVIICKILGMSEGLKANHIALPHSHAPEDTISFCHKDHDGGYLIGAEEWLFELKFSAGSARAVYISNDPSSINGVAIAKAKSSIADVADATDLNYTSRSRLASTGEVVVLKNSKGFYAALKILQIQDALYGSTEDAITLEYRILKSGGFDFSV